MLAKTSSFQKSCTLTAAHNTPIVRGSNFLAWIKTHGSGDRCGWDYSNRSLRSHPPCKQCVSCDSPLWKLSMKKGWMTSLFLSVYGAALFQSCGRLKASRNPSLASPSRSVTSSPSWKAMSIHGYLSLRSHFTNDADPLPICPTGAAALCFAACIGVTSFAVTCKTSQWESFIFATLHHILMSFAMKERQ